MHAFHDVTDASGTNNFNENYLDNMINDEKIWRPFLLKLAGDPKYRNSKYMNHVVAKQMVILKFHRMIMVPMDCI